MASRDELQTLKRGLKALAIFNAEGPSNVALIARRLAVPRANAHRIVNTLVAEGYCRKIPNSHLYNTDLQGGDLVNAGLTGAVTAASIDIVETLSTMIKWPLALSMSQSPKMVSWLATHLSNPFALAKITPGHTQPMLEAATGIVYLANADEQARTSALAEIAAAYPSAFAVWEPYFERVFETVREERYFIIRRTGPEASLGVPIMLDGHPVAGIAMRYMKSCVSRAKVVEHYQPLLQDAANRIEQALTAITPRRNPPAIKTQRPIFLEARWTPPPTDTPLAPLRGRDAVNAPSLS